MNSNSLTQTNRFNLVSPSVYELSHYTTVDNNMMLMRIKNEAVNNINNDTWYLRYTIVEGSSINFTLFNLKRTKNSSGEMQQNEARKEINLPITLNPGNPHQLISKVPDLQGNLTTYPQTNISGNEEEYLLKPTLSGKGNGFIFYFGVSVTVKIINGIPDISNSSVVVNYSLFGIGPNTSL